MEIADAAFKFQKQLEAGDKVMVGVNKYTTGAEEKIPILEIYERVEKEQIERLREVRRRRDGRALAKSLNDIRQACKKGDNGMPHCIEAAKNLATVQEICDVYREVYFWRPAFRSLETGSG